MTLGIGAYHDSKLVSFEILDANDLGSYELHDNLDVDAGMFTVGFDYPGGEDGVLDLELGKDFEVEGWYEGDYWDKGDKLDTAPSEEGDYTLVLSGTGSFTGKKWVEFWLRDDLDAPIELKFSEPTIFRNAQGADEQAALKAGDTFTSGKVRYTVISPAKKTVAYTKLADKKAKTASVPATVKAGGVKYRVTKVAAKAFSGTAAKTVALGKNVASVVKSALSGSAATTVTVKSTAKPTKKTFAKGCFSGSKVKTVKVPKAQKKAYKKLLTKAYAKTGAKKLTIK